MKIEKSDIFGLLRGYLFIPFMWSFLLIDSVSIGESILILLILSIPLIFFLFMVIYMIIKKYEKR